MSVFNPRSRKLIVEAARDLMEGCRADDGSIDKERLEAALERTCPTHDDSQIG